MIGTTVNRWDEARDTLRELLTWLEDTRHWVETAVPNAEPLDEEAQAAAHAFEAMEPDSSSAPASPPTLMPSAPNETNGSSPCAVAWSPDRAAYACQTVAGSGDPATAQGEHSRAPDLFTVLAELTALRQEVKLQTRSAYQDRTQAAGTIDELAAAVSQLDRWRSEEVARREVAVGDARRSAAELLMDLHDALSRAAVEASSIVQTSVDAVRAWEQQTTSGALTKNMEMGWRKATNFLQRLLLWWRGTAPDNEAGEQGSWGAGEQGEIPKPESLSRAPVLPCSPAPLAVAAGPMPSPFAAIADRLDAIAQGYNLSVRRLERALAELEIEPIECRGRPVDPNEMEVVQSVSDTGRPAGVVISEIRRGYRRQGRVLRFAQVVVTRSAAEVRTAAE